MKKKWENDVSQFKRGIQKFMLIMRLTIVLTLALTLTVSAGTYSQNTKLNLSLENATIEQVLLEIENNSKFIFIYESGTIDKSVIRTISVKNQTIDAILSQLLEGTDVNYTIDDRQVLLYKKDSPLSTINQLRVPSVQSQQTKSISGKVTDSSGSALPGVSVVIKGTTKGTITDMDGKFTLTNVPGNAKTLVFSFIGMKSQEVVIGDKLIFLVKLEEESVGIEEVVAVGYGTMKKIDMTGSAASVQAKDLVKVPVKSFDEAMAGRIAGVQITSNDGQPGAMPNIIIRGANSLTQDNSPLYVIDGFPIEGNDNNTINPNDIESIDILKDASATAIYGARGANGVIMITTKRGKEGAPVVSYNGYTGIQKDIRRVPVMNPYEFVQLQLEINSTGIPSATETYLTGPGKTLEDYKTIKAIDWYSEVLQAAKVQNHDISVSGGTSKSRYSASLSYLDQDGIFINSGFRRYQGRVTLDQTISNKLKIGLNVNYGDTREYGTIATNNGGSLSANLMYSIWSYRPVQPDANIELEDELTDPAINPTVDYRANPLLTVKNEIREKLTNSFFSNGFAEYSFVKNLKLRVTGGINRSTSANNEFNNSKTRTGNSAYPQSLGPNGRQSFTVSTNFTNENTLTYSKTFNKQHSLNLIGGYTQQRGKISAFGASAIQISNETLGLSGLDEGIPNTISASSSEWTLQSFLTRVNYNYKSKYMLTASVRADGSSKFIKENRWGYFPSAALAYRLSSEEFMKSLRFITDTKFRLSYGATGNNRVNDFAYLAPIIGNSMSAGYSFGNNVPSRGIYIGSLANPDLKWETTKQFNFGIDMAFLKNRITFTGDYYYKKTYDLLLNAQLPSLTGYSAGYKNIGSVSNNGVELSLNTLNLSTPSFKWNSSFNISFNKNKVLALTDNQEAMISTVSAIFSNPVYIAKVGHPIAQFYGPIFEGVYQYEDFNRLTNGTYVLKDEIPANGGNRGTILPGDAKYRDINHDGLINLSDYTVIGNPNPDFIGGLNNNFEYKGFDLNVFFQFSYGNDVLNANRIAFEWGSNISANTNQYKSYVNRWTPENTNTIIPRAKGYGANFYSSRIIEDASFLRLKTVSLGYTLPAKIIKQLKMKSIRVYTSAQNLYTWSGYSGIDPEVSTRHTTLTPAFDYSPYPRVKTITFGLNATF